jgi:ribosome-binding ATPase YchF (GTP1/OBG family)
LTNKPFIYAINVGEDDLKDWEKIKSIYEDKFKKPVAIVCAKLEEQLLQFTEDEIKEYLDELKQTW